MLAVFDLDKTLLDPKGTISPRTLAALIRWISKGNQAAVASARPVRSSLDVTQDFSFEYYICVNGAVLLNAKQQNIGMDLGWQHPETEAIVKSLRYGIPGCLLGAESRSYLTLDPGFPDLASGLSGSQQFRFPGPGGEMALRILVAPPLLSGVVPDSLKTPSNPLKPSLSMDELLAQVLNVMAIPVELTRSSSNALEILRQGVTKGNALLRLCHHLGIPPEETIAFGDAPNDISMFQAAKYSCAMGNASPEVKARATHVIGSNGQEGVARTLETIMNFGLSAVGQINLI